MAGRLSPIATGKSRRSTAISAIDVRQSRVEPGLVHRLFSEGDALCETGHYEAAEEKWKQALQIDQNDTRTLLHYGVMLRDRIAPKKREGNEAVLQQAEQLLRQAMGDSFAYVSCGLTSPAKDAELAKSPKLKSPKKDIQRFHFRHAALRSKVEFHSLKTIRKQIETMELSLRGDSVDGQDDEESRLWDEDEEHDDTSPEPHSGNEPSLIDAPSKGCGRKGAGEVNAGGGEVDTSPTTG